MSRAKVSVAVRNEARIAARNKARIAARNKATLADRERSEEMQLAYIRKIEQDFAAGQSMSKSLLKASRRIDCGDRCAKLVAGN
jgi:hypothetical protein